MLERGLQLVTARGAACKDGTDVAALASLAEVDPWQAQYWGLGRVVGAEQPHLGCRLIDIDPGQDDSSRSVAAELTDVILNDSSESQLALRDGRVLAPRLKSWRPTAATQEAAAFAARPDGAYLITGGLGLLGRQAALWLARRGAGHLVLVSRREPAASLQPIMDEIEAMGSRVHVHLADLSRPEDVERLIARCGADLPALRGVIHAAGLVNDALLADQSWERFDKVLGPKVRGATLLHEATAKLDLDFFVLYSSAASVLGSPGQSNYATANAYMDGLAWRRRQAGLPALSVNWGPWTEGMADNELIVKRLALQGITPLTIAEAHQALEKLLVSQAVQATVLDVDWRRMRMGLGGDAPPLLDEVAPMVARQRSGDSALIGKLKTLQGPARKRLLVDTIQSELQQILSAAQPPDLDTPLTEMGLDSLMAVEFSTRLQQQLGDDFAIAPTLLYDYPTVNAISDYLLELASDDAAPEAAATTPTESRRETQLDDVAIVGMSCRFPGASSLAEFWSNLLQGVDSVREIPSDRWDVDKYYQATAAAGKMYTRQGGFLNQIREFDADFFNISELEACWLDPQHRLMLEVSWEALEDAAIATQPLADPRVGVFMGIMSQDYGELLGGVDVELIDGFQGAGLSHSAGVGRLSYAFGFEGPCLAIDSASSSSLVAVCQAVKSLLEGNCNVALAGGVNAILTPTNSLLLSKARMLAPDGRCKSFSAKSDGFGRGEGCGVVVLKRLSDARRDGDRVLAVIRGAAVSHNGFSGGLTTPSGRAQERVIREALDNAGITPGQIQYLEAHGTGTELGDPIEIRAAASALGKGRAADQPLLVGSVKANIGHLEAAGGVSGLIKAVLAMHHGVIPRQLHFDEPSPHVPWAQLPLRIVQEQTPWPETDERIAGVTALGLSGTNAHVVLSAKAQNSPPENEENKEDSAPPPGRSHHMILISARNEPALREAARRQLAFIDEHPRANLADIAHTLAVGRRHFEHRAALVAKSLDDARRGFIAVADSNSDPHRQGHAPHIACVKNSPKLAWVFDGRSSDALGAARFCTTPSQRFARRSMLASKRCGSSHLPRPPATTKRRPRSTAPWRRCWTRPSPRERQEISRCLCCRPRWPGSGGVGALNPIWFWDEAWVSTPRRVSQAL